MWWGFLVIGFIVALAVPLFNKWYDWVDHRYFPVPDYRQFLRKKPLTAKD